jgi:tetratricopeptide (TPR) repeat protein
VEKELVDAAKALIKDGKLEKGEILLNLVAEQLVAQKDYKRAEKVYQDLLEHRQATYGKQSPVVASTLVHLASLCESDQRYPDAKKYYQRGLEVSKEAFKDVDNPFVPFNLASIARMDVHANDLAAAAKGFKAALEIYEKGDVFRFGKAIALDAAAAHLGYAQVLKQLAEKNGDETLKAEANKEKDRAEEILKVLAERNEKLPVPGNKPRTKLMREMPEQDLDTPILIPDETGLKQIPDDDPKRSIKKRQVPRFKPRQT